MGDVGCMILQVINVVDFYFVIIVGGYCQLGGVGQVVLICCVCLDVVFVVVDVVYFVGYDMLV